MTSQTPAAAAAAAANVESQNNDNENIVKITDFKIPLSPFKFGKFKFDNISYNSLAQSIFALKAKVFKDQVAYDKVMKEKLNPTEYQFIKIENFDKDVWRNVIREHLFKLVSAFLNDNFSVKKYLIDTGDKKIYYIQKYDWVLGTGTEPKDSIEKARGDNYLGYVYETLRSVYQSEVKDQVDRAFVETSLDVAEGLSA